MLPLNLSMKEYLNYFCISYAFAEWGRTMIEEIIKLREDGLSFRKIASQLNTTVGKVQYRWNKYINSQENSREEEILIDAKQQTGGSLSQSSNDYSPVKGELQIKLINPVKVIVYWEVSKIPEKIFGLFYNKQFMDFVHIVRIYDVTDITFTGENAHHYYDITVPYNKGYWFIKGLTPNRSYIAELGAKYNEKDFFPILRSNSIQTPAIGNVKGSEIFNHFIHAQQIDHRSPKWIDHVSTYSYYGESKKMEQRND
jgi:uncharacterized protein